MTDDVRRADGQVSAQAEGRWLSIQDAARHLSVSERTIYRRADRGHLRRRVRQDGRVEVWLPLSFPDGVSDAASDFDSHERALILVDRFGDVLTRQLGPLASALSESQVRTAELAREYGQLRERVVTLERELLAVRQASDTDRQARDANLTAQAPGPTTEPSDPPSGPVPAPAPAPIPPGPNGDSPWWRRSWAALAGA